MMINLPKVEMIQAEGKQYSAKDKNRSFQTEDWRAKWYDHHYALQVKGIDFKKVSEEQGNVYFAYGHLEFIVQELAAEFWPIMKTQEKERDIKPSSLNGGRNEPTKDWQL